MAYCPWLTVKDVPSKGDSSVAHGILIARNYHFLSSLELAYFFIRERQEDVVDIREQWPILDIRATEKLAAKYGCRHPTFGIYPEPFTIDFIVTRKSKDGLIHSAHSIKTIEDLDNPDVKRRLAVEYEWCAKNNIPWWVVDTSLFDPSKDPTALDSLTFMRAWFLHRYTPIDGIKNYVELFHEIHDPSATLNEITVALSKKLSINIKISLDTFRYCAWKNILHISPIYPLRLDMPVVLDG